jgi:biopolymer transport protein ExbD
MAGRFGDDGDDMTEAAEINVTPFIDVTLVLLIIFMVAAPLATVDVAVDLPSSTAQPQKRPDKPIYLTLKSDLTLTLGEIKVPPGGLAVALNAASNNDPTQRVFLRADKTVPYGELMKTMDALRDASYLKVALVAQEGADAPAAATP